MLGGPPTHCEPGTVASTDTGATEAHSGPRFPLRRGREGPGAQEGPPQVRSWSNIQDMGRVNKLNRKRVEGRTQEKMRPRTNGTERRRATEKKPREIKKTDKTGKLLPMLTPRERKTQIPNQKSKRGHEEDRSIMREPHESQSQVHLLPRPSLSSCRPRSSQWPRSHSGCKPACHSGSPSP